MNRFAFNAVEDKIISVCYLDMYTISTYALFKHSEPDNPKIDI